MTANDRQKSLGPFSLGVNNRLPDFKLRTKDGDFVRSAVNVDLTTEGSFKRRGGTLKLIAGDQASSLWSDEDDAFYLDSGTLYRLSGSVSSPVRVPLASGLPNKSFSYTRAGAEIYASNGQQLYRISGNSLLVAGVPLIAPEPDVTAASGGSLPAGEYQVCFTYVAEDLEESGSTVPVRVSVGLNGALSFTNIPTPPAGAVLRVYMTSVNDNVLLRAFDMPASGSFTLTARPTLGSRCMTLLLRPMPAGDVVRWLNGRLYVAAGDTVYYSEPYAPTLFNPARNYILFPSTISMLETCQNGLYVAADQTYWLGGDPSGASLDPVLPYGAVPGSSVQSPVKNECFWMSVRGLVRGDQNGVATNLQEAFVAVEPAQAGSTLFREQDGVRQVLSSLFGGEQTVTAARSYMDAEVIRKETIL